MLVDENANATIAPGPTLSNRDTPVDINDFHEGELHECKGCSMAKRIRMSILPKTDNREYRKLSRVFVDLDGKKHVTSVGKGKGPMIVRGDFSRCVWVYFVFQTHDATEAFKKFLADRRIVKIPSEVVVVRSGDGGEFNLNPENSQQYNGVA